MDYTEFEGRIERTAAVASEAARHRFASESIRMLHRAAEPAIESELSERERRLLSELLEGLDERPVGELIAISGELDESMTRDDVRAIEFDHDLIELLGVIENWLNYRTTGEPSYVAEIAKGMVNSIDAALQDSGRNCPPDELMNQPEICEEFGRMQRLLSDASEGT